MYVQLRLHWGTPEYSDRTCLRHWDGPVGENVDYHRQKKSVEKYFIARGYK
jgi:hypothetical protein